jgi:hypothetical protein
MSWSTATEHKLLLCTLPTETLLDHNWEAVAQMMGKGYTAGDVWYALLFFCRQLVGGLIRGLWARLSAGCCLKFRMTF